MIEARVAGREEIFIPDNALVQCTEHEYSVLRRMIRGTPGVTSFYDPHRIGHTLRRDFPVPSITTLPEEPHGEHVPRAW